jgi:hypothetical protein
MSVSFDDGFAIRPEGGSGGEIGVELSVGQVLVGLNRI